MLNLRKWNLRYKNGAGNAIRTRDLLLGKKESTVQIRAPEHKDEHAGDNPVHLSASTIKEDRHQELSPTRFEAPPYDTRYEKAGLDCCSGNFDNCDCSLRSEFEPTFGVDTEGTVFSHSGVSQLSKGDKPRSASELGVKIAEVNAGLETLVQCIIGEASPDTNPHVKSDLEKMDREIEDHLEWLSFADGVDRHVVRVRNLKGKVADHKPSNWTQGFMQWTGTHWALFEVPGKRKTRIWIKASVDKSEAEAA